jgi:hypothetical protein
MDNALTQLGVGGILVVLVLREVFAFLKSRKNGGVSGVCQATPCQAGQLAEGQAKIAVQLVAAAELDARSVRCLEVVINKCEAIDGSLSEVRQNQAVLLDRMGRVRDG